MHCPGERCPPFLLPGPKFITELLPGHPEPFANTCHPLSITKSPVPRWQGCPQPGCPQPGCPQGATVLSLAPRRPLVQPCLLLLQEPCETTRLLPRREAAPKAPQPPAAPRSPRGDKKRVARSLPPCAPRCPEPGRLRFPPCGIRCSSASCRGQCRSPRVAASPPRRAELAGGYSLTSGYSLTGGYSLPLRGVTECPPQQSAPRSFLPEPLAPHRCSRGYPTQELGSCLPSEPRPSGGGGPKAAEEAPRPLRAVAKGAPPLPGTKGRSCSAQHLSKARSSPRVPRAAPRPSRLAPAAAKRSGHAKKSRGASRWIW